jgi:hypothetical protein
MTGSKKNKKVIPIGTAIIIAITMGPTSDQFASRAAVHPIGTDAKNEHIPSRPKASTGPYKIAIIGIITNAAPNPVKPRTKPASPEMARAQIRSRVQTFTKEVASTLIILYRTISDVVCLLLPF